VTSLVFAGRQQGTVVIPDIVKRLNMLRPARYVRSGEEVPGFSTYVADWTKPASYLKDWLPFNLADEGGSNVDTAGFGAFTTAPDATTDTARLLTDTTANSQHSYIAGWISVIQGVYGKLRLAVVLKAATRTRVLLEMTTQGSGSSKFGCNAGFDLLNGRVFKDTTAFGSPDTAWTLFPAQISHMGSGWFLCIVDAVASTNSSGMAYGIFGKLYLDNGSGLTAQSTTYAGDGTSGVYGWRSNMLPSRTWDLGTVSFFDDFDDDTMANIDLADSRTSGFDWYVSNAIPGYDGNDGSPFDPTPANTLSVANSALTCSAAPVPLFLESFTISSPWTPGQPYSGGYVGKGWVVPALFECRAKWDISLSNQNDAATMWTAGLEYLIKGLEADRPASREYDFFEALRGGYPRSSMIFYAAGATNSYSNQSIAVSAIGPDLWYATREYPGGESVVYAGTPYTALSQNTGHPPDTSPTYWGAYVEYQAEAEPPPAADHTSFHDFATLWLPYDAEAGEIGQIVLFYDGVMCAFGLAYGPGLSGTGLSSLIHQSDWQQMPVLLGTGPDMPISFDWIRVTQ
jgi:hypothetical protein